MAAYHWTCPYCNRDTTLRDGQDTRHDFAYLTIENSEGLRCLRSHFIVCPNPACRKFTLTVSLYQALPAAGDYITRDLIQKWDLIPPSRANAFPDYVPAAVLADYNEACLISDLSPKASATLSRRCLQGILRDYWRVKPGRLVDEINQIKDKMDPMTWTAIDSVRKIGNIGAHMENDINVLVDVDPNEATLLIHLIEQLIRDWYIAREQRQAHLRDITKVADMKDQQRKQTGPNRAMEATSGTSQRTPSEAPKDDVMHTDGNIAHE